MQGKVEKWRRLDVESRFDAAILDIRRVRCGSETGKRGLFTLVAAKDWAIVVPILAGAGGPEVVMVRQYRHGSDSLSLEFPGGVVEKGEAPEAAVRRELEEETGYRAGRVLHAGTVSPNPAFLENSYHVYVAFDLAADGRVCLDEHEEIDVELVPLEVVRRIMGTGECANAMMAAGLFLAERVLEKEGY